MKKMYGYVFAAALCAMAVFAACDTGNTPESGGVPDAGSGETGARYTAAFPAKVEKAVLTIDGAWASETVDLFPTEARSGTVALPYGDYSYSLRLSWTDDGFLFKKTETGALTVSADAPLRRVSFAFTESDFEYMPYFTAADNPADILSYAAAAPEDAQFVALSGISSEEDLKALLGGIAGFSGFVKLDLSECEIEAMSGSGYVNNTHVVALILPQTLQMIGANGSSSGVFSGWTNLESVVFPSSLRLMASYTFSGLAKLKEVDFSACAALKVINASTFKDCENLTTIRFPPSLKTIGNNAFLGCKALVSVDLSGTPLETIGDNVFTSCLNLETVHLPATLKSIGLRAFAPSSNPTASKPIDTIACLKLKIPDFSKLTALESIGNYAFSWSFMAAEAEDGAEPVLETIDLSKTAITTIGDSAFTGCTRVNKVIFPASLKTIGTNVFGNINPAYSAVCENLEEADFSRCTQLASIGYNSFQGCTKLKQIILPQTTLTAISNSAFQGCTALERVDLSQTALITISASVFSGCTALTTVKLPATLESDGSTTNNIAATVFNGCAALESLVLYAVFPPRVANANAFQGVNSALKIYVPDRSIGWYTAAANWSSHSAQFAPISEYVEIEDYDEGGY